MSTDGLGEILIETARIGTAMRVTAFHVATSTEVMFQAPANTPQTTIQRLAAQKIKYVLDKKKN